MVVTRAMKRRAGFVDYISPLPDAILLHILSFLALRDCIIVSSVSKRWRNLWTQVSSLTLNELEIVRPIISKNRCTTCHAVPSPKSTSCKMHKLEAARKKFADFVDRVLLLHSGCTINKFRLSFNYVPAAKLGRRIDTWIRLAFTSDIREIHLRFHDGKLMPHFMMPEFLDELDIYELPDNHFSPRFLKSLTLHCCKFKASEFRRFELLQKLVLSSVLLLDSSVTVITSKCPVLEDLHLEECIISHDFLVSEVDLKIKHLFFNRCYPLTMPTFQMDISTPHLETLAVSGCFVTEPYVRKATKLLSAGISIKTMSMTNAQETVLASFFAGLHSCQTLKLIGWSIQVSLFFVSTYYEISSQTS